MPSASGEFAAQFVLLTQLVMMVETFFGTLSIMLLGYVLGNREQF